MPTSWADAGHANLILDNLIEAGKAKPMIVVMPSGHAIAFGTKGNGPANNSELFDRYLTDEVMPTIEKKYRIASGAANRALAGYVHGWVAYDLHRLPASGGSVLSASSVPGLSSAFLSAVDLQTLESKQPGVDLDCLRRSGYDRSI